MSKKTQKRTKKTKLFRPSVLTFTRYTQDAWEKCYPDSTKEEWEDRQMPKYVYDFIDQNLVNTEQLGTVDMSMVESIKLITLDEEYFQYLEETGKENTPEERARYSLSDEKATELLLKHHLNEHFELMYLPVITSSLHGPISASLSSSTKEQLFHYLGNVYGADRVWFPGILFSLDDFYKEAEKFEKIGIQALKEHNDIRYPGFEKITLCDEYPLDLCFIPFVINSSLSSAILAVEDFLSDESINPGDHPFDFSGTGADKKVEQDFGADLATIYPYAIMDIMVEDFLETLLEEGEQYGTSI